MAGNSISKPAILVDLKKCRIRIHKNTLHSIGNTGYVLLLVNPENRTLAVLSSDGTDPRAHKTRALANQKSIELYSKSLIRNLRSLCCDWHNNQSYRLYGEIIINEGVALFHMDKSVLLNRGKS